MKLYGSLENRIAEGKTLSKLYVGCGVTEMCYTDREAYEIVEIVDEKHIIIRKCKTTRIDKNNTSESQSYIYELIPYQERKLDDLECMLNGLPKGTVVNNNIKLTCTKKGWKQRYDNGKWNRNLFTVGVKEKYFDYSF